MYTRRRGGVNYRSQGAARRRAGPCPRGRVAGRRERGPRRRMESPAVTFTLAYLVFAVCFVFPPDEVRSAGLTVQSLLAAWLGSEDAAFVQYHLRRSTGTLLAHSLLPLGERRAGGWAAFLPRCGQRARCAAVPYLPGFLVVYMLIFLASTWSCKGITFSLIWKFKWASFGNVFQVEISDGYGYEVPNVFLSWLIIQVHISERSG